MVERKRSRPNLAVQAPMLVLLQLLQQQIPKTPRNLAAVPDRLLYLPCTLPVPPPFRYQNPSLLTWKSKPHCTRAFVSCAILFTVWFSHPPTFSSVLFLLFSLDAAIVESAGIARTLNVAYRCSVCSWTPSSSEHASAGMPVRITQTETVLRLNITLVCASCSSLSRHASRFLCFLMLSSRTVAIE